ncbi:MAG: hypothetical protein BA863_03620 [Desulfovibrio sp. S3730MH75]|nr:MAG: hypothetical protein BA863_03620 [Desulfovibrio sp. S3730MH75]
MSDENKNEGGGEEKNYLGTWKTEEDAVEGLKNLQGKLSEQGSETGTLRKQVEDGQLLMEEMQTQLQAAESAGEKKASDREAEGVASEQAKINKAIADLDPVDEGYSAKLTSLIGKSNKLAARGQHDRTLAAATEAFKKELDDRDVKSAHKSFNDANADFKTPEMQSRIREYMGKDTTGMSDPLVAFREIQRDDAMTESKRLTDENAELTERLNLKEGAGKTGTVITKAQGTSEPGKTQPKTHGAERNQGMMDVLSKMKG